MSITVSEIYSASSVGGRPTQQDTFLVHPGTNEPNAVFGVFDGHGYRGHESSGRAREAVNTAIARFGHESVITLGNAITHALVEEDRIQCEEDTGSGTTATVTIVNKPNAVLQVVNIGDSAARIRFPDTYSMPLHPLHNAQNPAEVQRVQQLGIDHFAINNGRVYDSRWYGGGNIAMTRAIGDQKFKPAVSGEPETTTYRANAQNSAFVIVATDGLWGPSDESVRTVDVALTHVLAAGDAALHGIVDYFGAQHADNATAVTFRISTNEA